MQTFVLVVHIILAILMIVLILVQHGKGADAGASFGGGGAATIFGASGSGNFMTRLTAVLPHCSLQPVLLWRFLPRNRPLMRTVCLQFNQLQLRLRNRLKLHQLHHKRPNNFN